MENSDYKNNNEAALGLAKMTNTVKRFLMVPKDIFNEYRNMSWSERKRVLWMHMRCCLWRF